MYKGTECGSTQCAKTARKLQTQSSQRRAHPPLALSAQLIAHTLGSWLSAAPTAKNTPWPALWSPSPPSSTIPHRTPRSLPWAIQSSQQQPPQQARRSHVVFHLFPAPSAGKSPPSGDLLVPLQASLWSAQDHFRSPLLNLRALRTKSRFPAGPTPCPSQPFMALKHGRRKSSPGLKPRLARALQGPPLQRQPVMVPSPTAWADF